LLGHAQEPDRVAGTGAHPRHGQAPGELLQQAVGGQVGVGREQAYADQDDQPPAAGVGHHPGGEVLGLGIARSLAAGAEDEADDAGAGGP
jgi:hypothetical protein